MVFHASSVGVGGEFMKEHDEHQFVVTIQVLVSVTDGPAVIASPCALRITQLDEDAIEVYVPSLDEAVLSRFHRMLDSWMHTFDGMQVCEHTETVVPWQPRPGRPAWWHTDSG